MMNITEITENEYSCGLVVDCTFDIKDDDEHVGYACINHCIDGSVFLEWIEIEKEHRKRGFLRKGLLCIMEHLDCEELYFETSDANVPMYEHMGAVTEEYDDFREMTKMKICMSSLIGKTDNSR